MASGSDRDAGAFLEAATIYNSRQQRAIYELVRLLKQYGLWSKMKAIYPFVGGTATTHKWNLKDPQDTDAAFRLTFSGGWTHNANGVTGNASSAYGNTYLTPNTALTENNTHLSIYSRTNNDGVYGDIGLDRTPNFFDLILRVSNTFYGDHYNRNTGAVITANTNSSGFFITSRTSSTSMKAFRNTTQLGNTITASSVGFSNLNGNMYLAALNSTGNVVQYYTNRNYAFASIGDGLTDTEAANLYYAVQRYQQILGRAV